MMDYDILNTFRNNYANDQEGFKHMPEGVRSLFEEFLDSKPTNEDIMHLLALLCNEDKHEWDSIAHYFL